MRKKKILQKVAAIGQLGLLAKSTGQMFKGVGNRISQGFSNFTGNKVNAVKASNLATKNFQAAGKTYGKVKKLNPNINTHLGLTAAGTGLAGAYMMSKNENQ